MWEINFKKIVEEAKPQVVPKNIFSTTKCRLSFYTAVEKPSGKIVD